ncbi:DUF1840 domain-containing protein [Xylophilus sp.]|uniref:DUF1840 domain-containing protein n=1 Tax=Xylophilus sp. TaxID=2653893 RepID=UPI0013BAC3C6|nr:DUF1840 domain-containing protein [Xylophilus sp.]KAF1050207.1 MAG: hypothetical protein GAK38_00233 [Xylophilus sp.]
MFKFTSRATNDVLLLDSSADQLLRIIGKDHTPQGVVTVDQIPGAIAALRAAVARDEAHHHLAGENADGSSHHAHAEDSITLRQRVTPLIDMLQRSAAERKDVVWGV